jgi:ABC-type branched-subunit amino acid transport system ATPase component
MLEIRDLRAGYGQVQVLHGVDLDLGEGEIVALLGSNGAGKSTLNNNVSGIFRPFGGSIRLGGEDGRSAAASGSAARTLPRRRRSTWSTSASSRCPRDGASFPT